MSEQMPWQGDNPTGWLPEDAAIWLDDDVTKWLFARAEEHYRGNVSRLLNMTVRMVMRMEAKPDDPWAGVTFAAGAKPK